MNIAIHPPLAAPAQNRIARVRRLSHDMETYCDESVLTIGADAYSRHPSCELLMCAYAFDNEEIEQWVPVEAEIMPPRFEDALLDERVIKTAWSKPFEYAIWKNVVGITVPHEQWRCTQALSYALALPGSLDKAGEVVGIAEDQKKQSAGRALIRLFSQPRKPTKNLPHTRVHWWMEPARWQAYKDYNRGDVAAERAILKKLRVFDLPQEEWDLWVIDQIINERGIPMNMRAVDAAVRLYEHVVSEDLREMKRITGLANPNSGAQLLPWLQERGYVYDDLKAGHVKAALEEPCAGIEEREAAHRVLTLRQDTARTSPKKYYAIQRCVDRAMGVLRNTLQFAGAGRTWRWAGRVFQPQNLPRPNRAFKKIIDMLVEHLEKLDVRAIELVYGDLMPLLVTCIRAVAQAPDGFLLIDADLNAIENRVLGWIARDRKILRVYREGRCPYVDFATYMFHQPYEVLWAEYQAGDDSKRTIAKPAVLGCGYRLGPGQEYVNHKTGEVEATGLLGYARGMYVDMTPEQAALSVKVFRETFTDVCEFWYGIERAMTKCVRTGLPTEYNMLRFDIKAPFLRMILPSGRALHYCRPRIEPVLAPWGEWKDAVTYEGMNDKNQWIRLSTHGGKVTENADQAIARDVLAGGLKRAHRRGLDIRLHVHDQIIGCAPIAVAERHLEILQECMAEPDPWHTFDGLSLPLASAGFVSKVFKKD